MQRSRGSRVGLGAARHPERSVAESKDPVVRPIRTATGFLDFARNDERVTASMHDARRAFRVPVEDATLYRSRAAIASPGGGTIAGADIFVSR